MRFHFAILMLATLCMLANSKRPVKPPAPSHSPSFPPSHSPSFPPGESPSAPAPSDCMTLMYDDLISCVEYLVVGSNDTKVPADCCTGFETIVEISPNCICEGLNAAKGLGFELNMTRAKGLPRICRVSVPPSVKTCKVSPAPSAGPAGPPDSSSPESPPEEPPISPSAEAPRDEGLAPSTNPSAPSPSKGGAYSISISFLGLISLLVSSFSLILV